MCTTKEGKELEDVWKKYRWFYRRVDPEDMKYLDWIRVSFMKVDFSIRDGEICARTGGLRDRFHRMDTEPQRGSDIVREARRASPRRHSWHLSRTAQIQPYIRNGYGGVHLRTGRSVHRMRLLGNPFTVPLPRPRRALSRIDDEHRRRTARAYGTQQLLDYFEARNRGRLRDGQRLHGDG